MGSPSSGYGSQTLVPRTMDTILNGVSSEVKANITKQLRTQDNSVKKMGWAGPFVIFQKDLTSAQNVEFSTVSLSFIPDNWSSLERLFVSTKASPG